MCRLTTASQLCPSALGGPDDLLGRGGDVTLGPASVSTPPLALAFAPWEDAIWAVRSSLPPSTTMISGLREAFLTMLRRKRKGEQISLRSAAEGTQPPSYTSLYASCLLPRRRTIPTSC